jgi:hypothetical protein
MKAAEERDEAEEQGNSAQDFVLALHFLGE